MSSRLALPVLFVLLLSVVIVPHVYAQQTLENPQPGSFQSGIGVISGWTCNANTIEISFNGGPRLSAATGTIREDTQGVCGDTDNGFGLLYNWNRLGDGVHTVTAYADGVEFASMRVTVTTLGEEFLRGASGTFPLTDFPTPGETRTLRWQQAQQNFVITAGRPQGGGTSGAAPHILENPQPGSFQSGVGVISGWACDTQTIEISFNGGPRIQAGTGTIREDTQGVCGDTDNGFGLLYNWNRLRDGVHTVTAYADGVEFAQVSVTVTTLGEEFRRGLSHVVGIPDFPAVGTDVVLQWQEAQQNFVIIHELPTQRLVEVTPTVTLPAGVQIPNVSVSSLHAETATVRASPEPTLLIAEDADSIVLLGLANMDGGLLGDRPGEAEVSVASTVVTLVGLIAGISVTDMTPGVVDAIVTHPHYPAITTALSAGLASDPHFLASIGDDAELVRLIEAVADDLPRVAPPQGVFANTASRPTSSPAPTLSGTTLPDAKTEDPRQRLLELLVECDIDETQYSEELARLQTRFQEIGLALLNIFVPIEAGGRVGNYLGESQAISEAVDGCVGGELRRYYQMNPDIWVQHFISQDAFLLGPLAFASQSLQSWLDSVTLRSGVQKECRQIIEQTRTVPTPSLADIFDVTTAIAPVQKLLLKIPKLGPILAVLYGKWEKAQQRTAVRTALESAVEAVEEYCREEGDSCLIDTRYGYTGFDHIPVGEINWDKRNLICIDVTRRSSQEYGGWTKNCTGGTRGPFKTVDLVRMRDYPPTCEGMAEWVRAVRRIKEQWRTICREEFDITKHVVVEACYTGLSYSGDIPSGRWPQDECEDTHRGGECSTNSQEGILYGHPKSTGASTVKLKRRRAARIDLG